MLTWEVKNDIHDQLMMGNVTLITEPGLSITGFQQAESCASICKETFEVEPGMSKIITLNITPNQPGNFLIRSITEWFFDGDDVPHGDTDPITLTITSQSPIAAAPVPTPTAAPVPTSTQIPTAAPTSTPLPTLTPRPTAIPSDGSGQGNQLWYIMPLGIFAGVLALMVLVAVAMLLRALLSKRKGARGSDGGPDQESDHSYYGNIRPPR